MMDDILVFGREEREYDEQLKLVLKRLRSGMTLNREKCEFKVREVEYLGHLVSGRGISTTKGGCRFN